MRPHAPPDRRPPRRELARRRAHAARPAAGAERTRAPRRQRRPYRARARGACHDDVTTTTSVAPSSRASAATPAALPAVVRAEVSTCSGTSTPCQAARISSASEDGPPWRAAPEKRTAWGSGTRSAAARRAAQIACRLPASAADE